MTLCLISSEDGAMGIPEVGKAAVIQEAADAAVLVVTSGLTYDDGLKRC